MVASWWWWHQVSSAPRQLERSQRTVIRLSRLIMFACASLASLNTELGFSGYRWRILVDRGSQVWSLVILISSLIKFFKYPSEGRTGEPLARDIVLLNYLPKVNEFGKLYYGLVCICIGSALVWRVYLNFFRPRWLASSLCCRIIARPEGGRYCVGSDCKCKRVFNAKCELMEFFMNGPKDVGDQENIQAHLSLGRQVNHLERVLGVFSVAEQLASRAQSSRRPSNRETPAWRRGYLSCQYPVSRSLDWTPSEQREPAGGQMILQQFYRVPIRSANFLHDHSVARWNFLAKVTFGMMLMVLVVGVPLLGACIRGLYAVQVKFGLASSAGPLAAGLLAYGCLEQAYSCSQAAMFFVFTNIFITLFAADLTHKARPIKSDLELLSRAFREEMITSLPRDELYRQQLRLWAYFDNILVLDDFVSKYAIIGTIQLIIGLAFGQSYLKVAEPTLRLGTSAALASNFLSFTYLHLVSWYIELLSKPMNGAILCILARERDHGAKREWQKNLFAFFTPDWKRTFTLGGSYTLNLQSYFKTIFGLATMSLVINRLFMKRAWEASFVHVSSNLATNVTGE